MIFYNIITFFDFYLFFALGAYGYYHFRVKYQGENEKIIAERKKYKRVANFFGAYLITTRVFKLMFYSVLFGHSLDPLTHDGKFAEGHHSAAWYECKAMSMPFMERFCFKAVEPNSTLDGACFAPPGHYGHYPDSCQMHLKNAYEDLDTQKEKDDFIKKQIERAKERGEMKLESMFFYLTNIGVKSNYLYDVLVEDCVNDYKISSCNNLVGYLHRGLGEDSFDYQLYTIIALELHDRVLKHDDTNTEVYDKDPMLSHVLNVPEKLGKYSIDVIMEKLKEKLELIKPGLSSEINMDYSKNLMNVDWACVSREFFDDRFCSKVLKRVFKGLHTKKEMEKFIKDQVDKVENKSCGDERFILYSLAGIVPSDNLYLKNNLMKHCVQTFCSDDCIYFHYFITHELDYRSVEEEIFTLLFLQLHDNAERKGGKTGSNITIGTLDRTEEVLKYKKITGKEIIKKLKVYAKTLNLPENFIIDYSRYYDSIDKTGRVVPCRYGLGCANPK